MFASVDFQASNNAQFLALISILEIMAKPAPRPKPCLDIIEDAMVRMNGEAETAMHPALRQALLDMHKGAVHWKSESIRSSVRRLAIDAARTLGDPDPDAVGRSAVRLYDKRSLAVHQGETASFSEALAARAGGAGGCRRKLRAHSRALSHELSASNGALGPPQCVVHRESRPPTPRPNLRFAR
jgi:hypothetical protein